MKVKKSSKLFIIVILLIVFLVSSSCDAIENTGQSNLSETTGQLIKEATKINGCLYSDGSICNQTCCKTGKPCGDQPNSYKKCDINNGIWDLIQYKNSDCTGSCVITEIKKLENKREIVEVEKEKVEVKTSDLIEEQKKEIVGSKQICTPNTFKCDGTILKKCNVDGSYWDYYKLCFDGCENGECLFKDKVTEPLQEPTPSASDVVSEVTDGDTIKLQSGEKVRLIGINTPETGQYYSSEAKNKLKEFVQGKIIKLEKDVSDADRYGRLLRYVYVDDLFVNLEMIRLGYAEAYKYPPDVKYSNLFEEAENEAKAKSLGIWKKSNENCIVVLKFNYDAEGNDNYNLNDEYVILNNICSKIIELNDWTIKDEATHIYTFSNFNFDANAQVTLYTGSGQDTSTELYWGMTSTAVWNNGGDTLFLRDNNGNLVLEESY